MGAIDQGAGGRRRGALVWDSIPTVGPLPTGRGLTINDFLRIMWACMIMPKARDRQNANAMKFDSCYTCDALRL